MQRSNRILKNSDFSRIIQTGNKIKTNFFTIYYVKAETQMYRIGITVSKKVSKLAVIRNKIKRRIVAIINNEFDKTVLLDMVIIPNQKILNLTFKEINEQLSIAFKKIYKLI